MMALAGFLLRGCVEFGMRFTLREMFAATFFIALVSGALICVENLSRFSPAFALLFFGAVMFISVIGLLALLIGAIERKERSDDEHKSPHG
jgi:hypothetical protein